AGGARDRALAVELAARPFSICIASHQLEDAYRWADDIRALADGRLSPVTPENLFRVELPPGDGVKTARVGNIDLVVMTDRAGPVVVAVPSTDLIERRQPVPAAARNVSQADAT